MAIKTIKIKSLSQFLQKIIAIRDDWDSSLWFRGHADSSWSLLPGIYRIDNRDEDTLRSEFERRAMPFLTDREPKSDWEWYFLMQHYGLPTRLLDWTQNALFALYFALKPRTVVTAAVWILDPWWFNQQKTGRQELMYVYDPPVIPYLTKVYTENDIPREPIAIIPRHISQRIVAQQSCFTLFGSVETSLDNLFRQIEKPRLLKFEISSESIPSIRNDLQTIGICETLVFPDLEGLCREIKTEWDYY